jgi:ABC-type multidrug transport system ATPase subunit
VLVGWGLRRQVDDAVHPQRAVPRERRASSHRWLRRGERSQLHLHLPGICPQADRVWDDLTVQQHLTFYARLQGVDRKHESALVQLIACMVSLDGDSFGKPASTLSGGTRRRLAIAISLVGNPRVWLLDEPTTGLSPEARREVWDIISLQKAYGRCICIIITSHAMDEVDTLCTRIGIVCGGRLEAVGTQQRLKLKYGDGYKLTLNFTQDTDFKVDPTLSLRE